MNATLARERIAQGWPELIPAGFPRDALILAMESEREDALERARGDAECEAYDAAEAAQKDLDAMTEERDAAVARADKLQSDLDAALDGDTSALWAAKLNALRSEVADALNLAAPLLDAERKKDARHNLMVTLRKSIFAAFAAATPEPKRNAA